MYGRKTFVLVTLLAASFNGRCLAEVYGPPTLLINAQIDSSGDPGDDRFVGSVLNWDETRQNWTRTSELKRGTQPARSVSVAASRAVFVLQEKRFVASLSVLRFARLNGDSVDASDVPELLEEKRAVALIPKGCAIHPYISKALHPETLVVTRVSYPNDPILIPLPSRR